MSVKSQHTFHLGASRPVFYTGPEAKVGRGPLLYVDKERADDGQERGAMAVDVVLGGRVRHLRKVRNLSLKEVAARAGISIGFLSQIERGRSSASVRVLASLADSLQVGLGSLFEEDTFASTPEVGLVVRRAERKQLSFWRTGISKELLTPSAADAHLAMFLVHVEPGGTTGTQLYSHQGEEAGFVLEGEIVINVEGHEFILHCGDSFRFVSTRSHSFRNAAAEPARVLWVNSRAPAASTR